MRRERLRLEFGVELAADEPRVVRDFHNFHIYAIRSATRDAESGSGQGLLIFTVEFVAMTMTLGDFDPP